MKQILVTSRSNFQLSLFWRRNPQGSHPLTREERRENRSKSFPQIAKCDVPQRPLSRMVELTLWLLYLLIHFILVKQLSTLPKIEVDRIFVF